MCVLLAPRLEPVEMRGNPLPLIVRVQNSIMYLRGNMFMLHSGKDIKVFFFCWGGELIKVLQFSYWLSFYILKKSFFICVAIKISIWYKISKRRKPLFFQYLSKYGRSCLSGLANGCSSTGVHMSFHLFLDAILDLKPTYLRYKTKS